MTNEVESSSLAGEPMAIESNDIDCRPADDSVSGDLTHLLRIYYQRFFPYREFYLWLTYGEFLKQGFPHREFSFTLQNDVYLRYKSFQDMDEMKQALLEFIPNKIDIGAIYTTKPKNKQMIRPGGFLPVQKELVFDIDMTDYDDVRTCCSGGEICLKCWEFMTIAIKVINRALTEDFGFQDILWVYSGRRGVHCWVCDDSARMLKPEVRRAIVYYLEVVKGGENQSRKVNLGNVLHPSLSKAYSILENHFGNLILKNQDVLGSPDRYKKVLDMIPDEKIRNRIDEKWNSSKLTSEDRWFILEQHLTTKGAKSSTLRNIIFQHCYPRLDVNVSIQLNHLLKSPFCIHPSTGRVCVPIDPVHCDSFNPLEVPTISKLLQELNEYDRVNNHQGPKISDINKTSLKMHCAIFKSFVDKIVTQNRAKRRALEDMKLSF